MDWWHQCFLTVGGTSRTFSNNYTRQRGLEPLRRPATAFAMVSPVVLDFGRVLKDTLATRDGGLTVSNVGTGGLEIQRVRLIGPHAAAFSLASLPSLPRALQQGQAFSVSVRFQGGSEGRHEARVAIAGRDLRSGSQFAIDAVLLANVVAPDMDVLPTTVNFGLVQAGQEVVRNVLVTNNGSAPLRFRVPPPEPWSFFQWSGDLPLQWRSLPPGGGEAVAIRYKPAVIGTHSSSIAVVAEDETVTVRLLGERVPAPLPSVQAVPRQVSFGVVDAGRTETVQLVAGERQRRGPYGYAPRASRGRTADSSRCRDCRRAAFKPDKRPSCRSASPPSARSKGATAPRWSSTAMRPTFHGCGWSCSAWAWAPRPSHWLEPVLTIMMR